MGSLLILQSNQYQGSGAANGTITSENHSEPTHNIFSCRNHMSKILYIEAI